MKNIKILLSNRIDFLIELKEKGIQWNQELEITLKVYKDLYELFYKEKYKEI